MHRAGKLLFFGEFSSLADAARFRQWLAPMRRCEWVVYAKRPFAGPAAALAYLSRYTHRVAISNSRLLAMDERGVTFRSKDYRAKGSTRYKTMTLSPQEFMRRFLLHVLPGDFHRIRHYGLLANGTRRLNLAAARQFLEAPVNVEPSTAGKVAANDELKSPTSTFTCRHCGRPMLVLRLLAPETFIRAPPRVAQR